MYKMTSKGQGQSSFVKTLLLTGQAVEAQARGENIRLHVVQLIREHLGIADISPRDICACHRLRNPKVILVRFVALDTERVSQSTGPEPGQKPKKRGLLIFESLTSERLATVNELKKLKQAGGPHVLSYFTQGGKIFVRASENKEVRPVQIPFGASQTHIKDLCNGKKVEISPLDIRDHVRQVHSGAGSGEGPGVRIGRSGDRGPGRAGTVNANHVWSKVVRKGNAGVQGIDLQYHSLSLVRMQLVQSEL